jgi:hypothetical protein
MMLVLGGLLLISESGFRGGVFLRRKGEQGVDEGGALDLLW